MLLLGFYHFVPTYYFFQYYHDMYNDSAKLMELVTHSMVMVLTKWHSDTMVISTVVLSISRLRTVRQPQMVIVQRLVKSLYLTLIVNYCQLHDHEYQLMSITRHHIPINSVQMLCVSKCAQENSRGGYQTPFSTEAFEDTQAY